MKKGIFISTLFLLSTIIIFSCNKDYSFEGGSISVGSLKSNGGDCLGSQLSGTFIKGRSLTDSNLVTVIVRVIKPGSYRIVSDTINGYSFTGNGIFSDSGIVSVVLKGNGTPKSAINSNFKINYNSTFCPISVNVQPVTTEVNANYSLQGSPNSCMAYSLRGVYINTYPLTDSNYVIISVNVVTAGKYTIKTDQVNGYNFTAYGVFTTTGIQTVSLKGSGQPIVEGSDLFTITAGISNCTFSVAVVHPIQVKNTDHFPLTGASFWNYNDLANPPDTLNRKVLATKSFKGNSYINIEETYQAAPSEFYFRKSDTSYYEYGSVDKYTTAFNFVPQINGDILFLKEHLKTGETWLSDEYIGPFSTGQKVFFLYSFTCLDANSNVIVTGNTFTNVYKIQMKPKIHSEYSDLYEDTGEEYTIWYALGIGIIYSKKSNTYGSPSQRNIRNWLVN